MADESSPLLLLTAVQRHQLDDFYRLLIEWNSRMNLTNITDRNDVDVKHFYDSLWIRELPDWRQTLQPSEASARVLDVGSGAGFPGIPLAICEPSRSFVLLDSLNKRVGFLQTVVRELGLGNVQAIHARAEDVGHLPQFRDSFDAVVSRAVARLPVLVELMLPFVRVGGTAFVYKGPDVVAEVADAKYAVRALGGEISQVAERQLPDGAGGRSIICVRKRAVTPAMYPRRAGLPQKEPLVGRT